MSTPYEGGGGVAKSSRTAIFPFCSPVFLVINDWSLKAPINKKTCCMLTTPASRPSSWNQDKRADLFQFYSLSKNKKVFLWEESLALFLESVKKRSEKVSRKSLTGGNELGLRGRGEKCILCHAPYARTELSYLRHFLPKIRGIFLCIGEPCADCMAQWHRQETGSLLVSRRRERTPGPSVG